MNYLKNCIKVAAILITVNLTTIIAQGQNVFTPAQFQTQPMPNYSILQNSFQQNESRQNNASQKYSELVQAIGETMQRLSPDVETRKWYKDFSDELLNGVELYRSAGDYAGMGNKAVQCIAKLRSNSELLARIQTYEEYKRIVQTVQQRTDLTSQEKNDWLIKYPYKFVPIYYKGEVIGGRSWLEVGGPNNTPVLIP